MKVLATERIQIIVPPERGVFESNSSCTSTISKLAEEAKRQKQEFRRRIEFCEENNTVFVNTQITKSECRDLWYSQKDLNTFKAATRKQACKMIQSANLNQQHSIEILQSAYEKFTRVESADEIEKVMESCSNFSIDPTLFGLEKWVLRDLARDRIARRKYLVEMIHICNNDMCLSLSRREKALRKESRLLSRPSRIFAHYMAVALAYGEE